MSEKEVAADFALINKLTKRNDGLISHATSTFITVNHITVTL